MRKFYEAFQQFVVDPYHWIFGAILVLVGTLIQATFGWPW